MTYKGWTVAAAALALAACSPKPADVPASDAAALPAAVSAEGDFAANLQTALIEARPGDTVRLPEGTFKLSTGLSLDVDGVTVLGAGQDKTILDFSGQTGAGEGLLVTSDDVTLTGFGIRDTKGDGIKSKGADRIVYRDLTVDWSGEPDEDNGAYGVYPVESRDVLVENVTVRGASDAGIYVGQSHNIIVRNSLAEFNVAGIEIENSSNADVYGNITRDNTGGILVFDLPDLPVIGGHSTRIFNNQIVHNNTRNFAPPGNIVAGVPSGTGVIILANRNVHVFDNDFAENRSAHVLLIAYTEPFTDERYNPLPRDVVVRNNRWSGGGTDPQGMLAPLAEALGGTLPAIVSDGVTRWPGAEAQAANLVIDEAPEIGFVNLGIGAYPIDPPAVSPSMERPQGIPVPEPAAVTLPQDAE
ncbi:MAG: parallel beta-helix repeat-containing protein [Hyphomonas sp. BRH_c22]|uniref:parallel beta-helix domain-containing protein n=1 Tax=Hyphomonas sp. BRH_c22 TaxID=1629710 RepID=UPI0005F15B25|nr:parallel beta-helix domain-containing protein [Hyphomonas sp. BRH_c22]KJS38648.1 MAG: parallel beta-helix repeat-containing protein [Hyphomonas sp. BRH_c22]